MDEVLLRKIAQYVKSKQKIPNSIPGYSDDNVSATVQDMFDKNVLENVNASKLSPRDGNYTIVPGSMIPVEKIEKINIVILSEYDFEKSYGITWY